MEATTLLLISTVVVAAILFLFPRDAKRARLIQLTNKMPGPTPYPIVGTVLPFILTSRSGRIRLLGERLKMYRPMYRAWLGSNPTINIAQPEQAEVLLSNIRHIDKSFTYRFLHSWLGTGLLTSSGAKWHTHRKMITPTFHFKILDNFVEVFSEKSEILVQKLKREVGSPEFDMYPYITRCALDIICETAMGTPVHAQENVQSSYVSQVYRMSELTIQRMILPWLHPDAIFNLSYTGRKYRECLKLLHDFTDKVIRERKSRHVFTNGSSEAEQMNDDEALGKKRRVAFLDMLLEASEGGAKLTDEEIREEVDTFMFEGHDTTSAGMSWALYLLGLHPDVQVCLTKVQEKAYKEQESIFQGSDRSVTMKDLNEMKYLERVIKESLRLYPSVPGIGRTLKEDAQMGEYVVPAGATVHLHIYFLHRNPEQFPDPEKFDPDNFLPERVAKRHPYAYIPFSAGPRNCIGQKFALLEEKTVLSYVLRHYALRSLDKMEDIATVGELVLRPESGLRLAIAPRDTLTGV